MNIANPKTFDCPCYNMESIEGADMLVVACALAPTAAVLLLFQCKIETLPQSACVNQRDCTL